MNELSLEGGSEPWPPAAIMHLWQIEWEAGAGNSGEQHRTSAVVLHQNEAGVDFSWANTSSVNNKALEIAWGPALALAKQ